MHRPRIPARFPHVLALPLVALLLAPILAACGTLVSRSPTRNSAAPVHGAHAFRLTYVAIGASDAFGVGTDDPATESWPSVLTGELGPGVHLINLGIPGETVGAALQNELPVAVGSQPNVITIWLAVNDIADGVPLDTYRTQLTTMLATLQQRTHARVFVANVPDLTVLPYFSNQDPVALSERVQQWNTVIASVTATEGDVLVDLAGYSAQLAQHPEFLASDGLHPSVLGAEALAQVFATSIRQAGTS